MVPRQAEEFRLAEVIAALSLATDLADGHPLEKALRTCLLAVGVGRAIGLEGQPLSDVYYVSLLRFVGCTSFAHQEAAALGGDDIAVRRTYAPLDFERPGEVLPVTFSTLARGAGPIRRARAVATFLVASGRLVREMAASHCEVAARLAARLGLSAGVADGLGHMHERWDGKGFLRLGEGEQVALAARLTQLAHVAELHHQVGGREAACDVVRHRGGGQLDPELARAFLDGAPELLESIENESVWDRVLAAEPDPQVFLPASRLDAVARAFADFVDLKTLYTRAHSAGVAGLSEAAAGLMNLATPDVTALRHAALLHDLGRVSVPNGIWDKSGKLTAAEWERVRLHPYYTERVLSQSPLLRPLSQTAGMHHERLDGSGYHRSAPALLLPAPARLLAAADVYQALTEERPYRAALSPDEAAAAVAGEADGGRLDREVVQAVLEAAGHRRQRRPGAWPAGLSDREVEVLRAVAGGRSNKEVAGLLHISPRTVQHHLHHIYDKIGVSTRAGASLFAMENDLLRFFEK